MHICVLLLMRPGIGRMHPAQRMIFVIFAFIHLGLYVCTQLLAGKGVVVHRFYHV